MDKKKSSPLHLADAHIHLHSPQLMPTLSRLLPAARVVGVQAWLSCSIDNESWEANKLIATQHQGVLIGYGFHPWYCERDAEAHLGQPPEQEIREHAAAIGEIGLDRHCSVPMELQERVFISQLELARHLQLPVALHSRGPWDRLFALLDRYPVQGIAHNFTGSLEMGQELVRRGFLLSFGGMITRSHIPKIRRTLQGLPRESLLLETDAPDLEPIGSPRPNLPRNLVINARRMAELLETDLDTVQRTTTANFRRLFPGAEL